MTDTTLAAALAAAQKRRTAKLTLRQPSEPAASEAAELPKAPLPRVETPAPEPEPVRRSAAPPRKPDGGRPEFVTESLRPRVALLLDDAGLVKDSHEHWRSW